MPTTPSRTHFTSKPPTVTRTNHRAGRGRPPFANWPYQPCGGAGWVAHPAAAPQDHAVSSAGRKEQRVYKTLECMRVHTHTPSCHPDIIFPCYRIYLLVCDMRLHLLQDGETQKEEAALDGLQETKEETEAPELSRDLGRGSPGRRTGGGGHSRKTRHQIRAILRRRTSREQARGPEATFGGRKGISAPLIYRHPPPTLWSTVQE